jgi:hypothetical protein
VVYVLVCGTNIAYVSATTVSTKPAELLGGSWHCSCGYRGVFCDICIAGAGIRDRSIVAILFPNSGI